MPHGNGPSTNMLLHSGQPYNSLSGLTMEPLAMKPLTMKPLMTKPLALLYICGLTLNTAFTKYSIFYVGLLYCRYLSSIVVLYIAKSTDLRTHAPDSTYPRYISRYDCRDE